MSELQHHPPIVYSVYEELKKHIGRQAAISAADLAQLFNVSKRELRGIISTIRTSTELRKIVASSNNGYYICTAEEFRQANRRLEKQAFSLLKVAYANKKKAANDGQYLIPLGQYWAEVFESLGKK